MVDLIRVKDKETGHEYTLPSSVFDLNPDLYQKLDKPATDSVGTPLPAKHKTTVAKSAPAKTAAPVADTKEK